MAGLTGAELDGDHLQAFASAVRILTARNNAAGHGIDMAHPEAYEQSVDKMLAHSEKTYTDSVAIALADYTHRKERSEALRASSVEEVARMCQGKIQRDFALALVVLCLQSEHKAAKRGVFIEETLVRKPRQIPWWAAYTEARIALLCKTNCLFFALVPQADRTQTT